MNKNEIKWIPLVPLIGGQQLGAEKAFGVPPVAIYSFDGFQDNDSHYVHYMNNIRGNNLDYILMDDLNDGVPYHVGLDVVSGTPPLKLAA